MLTQAPLHRPADTASVARVRTLRTHAEVLRDGAEAPDLTTGQRTMLLRDAEAAERQAGRRLRAIRRSGAANPRRGTPPATGAAQPIQSAQP